LLSSSVSVSPTRSQPECDDALALLSAAATGAIPLDDELPPNGDARSIGGATLADVSPADASADVESPSAAASLDGDGSASEPPSGGGNA
jgi:hypothetical protein